MQKEASLMGAHEFIYSVMELAVLLKNGDVHANENMHTGLPFGDGFLCDDQPV